MAGTLAGRSAELQRGAAAGVARAFDWGSQFGAGLLWPHREHPNATRVAEELKFEKKNTFVGRWMVDFRWTGRCKQTFFFVFFLSVFQFSAHNMQESHIWPCHSAWEFSFVASICLVPTCVRWWSWNLWNPWSQWNPWRVRVVWMASPST